MSRTVEFFFDVGSPAAYIAWCRIAGICADAKAKVAYRPMLLGGLFHATGNHSPTEVPAKGRYMMDDLKRFAQRHAIPFSHNPFFPINTLMLMRGAAGLQMQDEAKMLRFVDAVYRAIWVDAKDMNNPEVVGAVLAGAGFDPAAVLALVADPAVKERLKATTQDAVERGAFGAPTFFVDGRMY